MANVIYSIMGKRFQSNGLTIASNICMKNNFCNGIFFARIKIYPSTDVDEVDIIALKDEESSNVSDTNIQIRGTREALKALAIHFKAEVTSKPPKFFERVVLPFQVML